MATQPCCQILLPPQPPHHSAHSIREGGNTREGFYFQFERRDTKLLVNQVQNFLQILIDLHLLLASSSLTQIAKYDIKKIQQPALSEQSPLTPDPDENLQL